MEEKMKEKTQTKKLGEVADGWWSTAATPASGSSGDGVWGCCGRGRRMDEDAKIGLKLRGFFKFGLEGLD